MKHGEETIQKIKPFNLDEKQITDLNCCLFTAEDATVE